MASLSSLRQTSRIIQSNRLHLNPTRTRNYSSHSLFTSSSSFRVRTRSDRIPRQHGLSQARYLSLWGSKPTAPPVPDTPPADLSIKEPSDFDRTVRASDNVSADASFQSHAPNSIEPQFIENAQQVLLEPHSSDGPVIPSLEEMPERVGYLKEVCGLDFGWGPTAVMQWILEHFHIWGGLSWTTSIVILGFALRSTMFPFLIGSAGQAVRMKAMSADMAPLQAQYREAVRAQDSMKMSQLQLQMRTVKDEHGVNLKKAFYPLLIQLPFGFGAWRLLRNSATLPVPGFVTESWLWTSDLTFSDPYYVMPLLSSVMIYTTLKMNQRAREGAGAVGGPDFMALLGKAMPVLSFCFVSFQPGAVQLYFVSSATAGLLTSWLLQNAVVRTFLKLPVLPKDQPLPSASTSTLASTESSATPKPEVASFMRTRSSNQGKSQFQILNERAQALADEEAKAARENKSGIDKAVDSVKGQWSDIRKHGRGFVEGITGGVEEQVAAAKQKQREEYEERVRAGLEEQREARNRELGVEETKREGGGRRRRK